MIEKKEEEKDLIEFPFMTSNLEGTNKFVLTDRTGNEEEPKPFKNQKELVSDNPLDLNA